MNKPIRPHSSTCRGPFIALPSLFCGLLALLSPQPIYSATPTPPDAGQILRETESLLPQVSPGKGELITPPELQSESGKGKGTIALKGFQFTGNDHISSEELLKAIPMANSLINTKAGLQQLNLFADEVTRYYRSQGYLVAVAYIPKQEVHNGIVALKIFEGTIDHSKVQGNERYSAEALQPYLDQALCNRLISECQGVVLERKRLDRGIGVVADLPGINEVSGVLSPGEQLGSTNIALNTSAASLVNGQVSADNYGNRYTGRNRLTGSLSLNNPLQLGDRLSLALITSGKGMSYGALDYSLPMGYDGWRAGVQLSHVSYELGSPFDETDAHGRADEAGIYASYPIIRSTTNNLFFRADYRTQWLKDSVLDDTFKKRGNELALTIEGGAIDGFGGGGLTTYSLTYVHGHLSRSGTDTPVGTPENTGNFGKLNYRLSRDQTLAYVQENSRISLYGEVRGQLSGRNLDSVEKFSLGGPTGVRAYPAGEAIGDRGTIATVELRYSTQVPIAGSSDLSISLFRDQGWLTVNHNDWDGYSGPSHRRLNATGIGIVLEQRDNFSLKASWAARDRGGEEVTSEPDSNSRAWVQASWMF